MGTDVNPQSNQPDRLAKYRDKSGGDAEKKNEKISIHVMPKRFYKAKPDDKKAQKTGLLILIVGIVFLLIVSVLAYFFLVMEGELSSLSRGDGSQDEVSRSETPGEQADTSKTARNDTAGTQDPDSGRAGPPADSQAPEAGEKEAGSEKEDDKSSLEPTDSLREDIVPDEVNRIEEEETGSETGGTTEENDQPQIVPDKPENKEYKSAPDTDGDGLSDKEEAVFGTSPDARDSDSDNYEDLSEILNLFNPVGEGRLIANDSVDIYTNDDYNYSLYYPRDWRIEPAGGNDSIMFRSNSNQFIQVIVQPAPEEQSLEDWYKLQFNTNTIKPEQKVFKQGWSALRNPNSLVAYLLHPAGGQILTITYNPGLDDTLDYLNIFSMMISTLDVRG